MFVDQTSRGYKTARANVREFQGGRCLVAADMLYFDNFFRTTHDYKPFRSSQIMEDIFIVTRTD